MITIKKPHIEIRNKNFYLISGISCTSENINEEIWYRTTKEYADYLVDEVADAFVLPMLHVALKNQEDIKVEAPISEKLYYNIKNNILYTLSIPLHVNHKINDVEYLNRTGMKLFETILPEKTRITIFRKCINR